MIDKQYEILLGKAFYYLNIRQRTEHEMREYLKKKADLIDAHDEVIDQVVRRLYDLQYLDDKAFTDAYISSRTRSKPKGEYVLRQELRQKGVPEEIVDKYFERHDLDESELAQRALAANWNKYQSLERIKRKKRATDFLMRRGFSYDSIKNALEWAEQQDDIER